MSATVEAMGYFLSPARSLKLVFSRLFRAVVFSLPATQAIAMGSGLGCNLPVRWTDKVYGC